MKRITLWTIGHSTRSLSEFVAILQAHNVELLVDVRTVPRSRHNPQFNKESLPAELARFSLEYLHMAGLGGLRRPLKDSQNPGWRNASFRGFADYMQTPEFEKGIGELIELAGERETAIMCAESLPWRCHRSLIADALTVRKVKVEHLLSVKSIRAHEVTPFAEVRGRRITYPAEGD